MTIDLNFMAATTNLAEVPLVFDNTVNTGAFKLAQKLLVLLFKDKESALLSTLGTDVLHLVNGNVLEDNDLKNQFNIAADRVRDYVQSTTLSTVPENEQLEDFRVVATVDGVDRSKVILAITVTTVSGEAINSTVPYSLHGD